MVAFNCPHCSAQLVFGEASPGMKAKCIRCGTVVQAPETLTMVHAPIPQEARSEPGPSRSPAFGIASLFALGGAVLTGVFMTMFIASHTEEMASLGAIAGIGFGFIACVLSLVLAAIGIAREERPRWPAFLGFALSVIPGSIGCWMLWKLLEHWYVG